MKVVLEKLTKATKVMGWYYLLRNHEVYCLSVRQDCKRSRLLERGLLGRTITMLDLLPWLGDHLYEAHRLAFENVEAVFEASVRDRRIVQLLAGLFGDGAVELAFKKELNRELFQFYSIDYIGSVLEKHFDREPFLFVPSRGECPHFFDGVDRYLHMRSWCRGVKALTFGNARMRLPVWIVGWNYLTLVRDWVSGLVKNLGLVALLLARHVLAASAPRRKKAYEYGVMVIAPQRQFANDIQGIDFLVDGDTIKRNEVLVIAPETLSDRHRRVLRGKQLDYVEVGRHGWDRNSVRKALSCALRVLWLGMRGRKVITDTARVLVLHFCKWSGLVSCIHLRHLVTYCDMELEAVPRNIILKKQGATLWYYMDSSNFGCYFAEREEDFKRYLHYRAGFLYYDYFISWSDQVSEYFKLHHQAILHYVTVGCLWAEHARDIARGAIRSRLRDSIGTKLNGRRVVSVFDSSFVDGSPTPYRDGVAFLAAVLRLLDEMADVFVILKEKKPRNLPTHPAEIVELYNRLERHPRCYATSPPQNSSEVIALSDLVIAFPFTSVGFEALTLGKRTVYFDASGTLAPTYYDRVPGLVCRGYDELVGRIRELLWSVPDEQYEKYLEGYVRGEIVPNCDGRALTRFREMLAGSTPT